MTTYTTRDEAIAREITAALGEYAADYDIEAIADEIIEYSDGFDGENYRLNNAGYQAREDVDFWEIAAKHDRAGE